MIPKSPSLRSGRTRLAALIVPVSFLLACVPIHAATESFLFGVGTAVPDGTTAGLADVQMISSSLSTLTDVNVTLDLSAIGAGGFNGDLYVTLVHDTGFGVLLNRSGRTGIAPFGYGDHGFAITLDDQSPDNVHSYRTTLFGNETTALVGTLTGSWKPDGRTTDPAAVVTSDTATTGLGSFNGTAGSGQWILFVADIERGATMRLNNWSLQLTGVAVPESSSALAALGMFGALTWFAWRKNRSR